MSKKAFDKIKTGLLEALAVVRGKTNPSRTRVVHVVKDVKPTILKPGQRVFYDSDNRKLDI